jgi:murein DD-endopeptidase MepM/ murein hydrolase activator NlpD
VHAPERFAIDFVQLDAENRLFEGPNDDLASYAFFGAPIFSATDGKVVRVQDGLPEQVPGSLPPNATVQTAGGNYIVVRADRGHYAFYAHLQPGSRRVQRGDRVRAGEVLGLLGNSGNTDGPHLHFHIMDSPSPLQSNGLPFTFTRFTGAGVAADANVLFSGEPAQIEPALLGPRRHRMPLDNQLVAFGD